MDFFQAIILSIVEGLSEFLPISSTGHLVLTSKLLNIQQTDFVKSFEVIIQLGAILAVVSLYFKRLINNISLWLKIIVAFLPSAFLGLLFYDFIKNNLIGNVNITLAALFLGGIALIILEKLHKPKDNHIDEIEGLSYKTVFLIGVAQSISMVPGVSRAAATIIGGLFLGLKRTAAVEFSFLLAIPTMLAATTLDLYKSEFNFSSDEITLLLVGLAGSFVTALFAIKFLLKFIKTHTFVPFGIYRIILAVLFWALVVI